MAKTLYFDESGYTGFDLLNREQPIFCVSSTDFDDFGAEQILRNSFPKYLGNEFKFSKIWARTGNRQGLLKFAEAVGLHAKRFAAYHVDKKIATLAKLIDFLVEPIVSAVGQDFYANEFCRRFANMFHFALINFAPPELYDRLVYHYHEFSRRPTLENLKRMQIVFRLMSNSSDPNLKPFLSMAALGSETFLEFSSLDIFRNSNDIQLTVVMSIVAYWRARSSEDFIVIHDQSSNFFRQMSTWEAITNSNVPPQTIGVGEQQMEFPLRVIKTMEGVSSRYNTESH